MSYWDLIDDDVTALRAQAVRHQDFGQGMADGSTQVAKAVENGASACSGVFVPAMCDVDTSRHGTTTFNVGVATDTSDAMTKGGDVILDYDSSAAGTVQKSVDYNLANRL